MHQSIIFGMAVIVILGITAQWLAWRFKIPAILLLLIFGFVISGTRLSGTGRQRCKNQNVEGD